MSDRTIPALTVLQPWASLIACGAKRYETRHWRTPYRGDLAIHAAKSVPEEGEELMYELLDAERTVDGWVYLDEETARALHGLGIQRPGDFPLGAVVCLARLVNCVPTERVAHQPDAVFGDFSRGRWAWELADVRLVLPPQPCRGYQGLWRWDPATKQSIAPDFAGRAGR
jgi:hypothetical protein